MEALKPKHTFNPVLQRFYQCVQQRAMSPDAPVTTLDPTIAKYYNTLVIIVFMLLVLIA